MGKYSQRLIPPNKPDNIDVSEFCDERGCLYPIEGYEDIPFAIERVFWIKDVPEKAERGNHAHDKTHQAVFCLKGLFELWVEGYGFFSLSGEHPAGVYIPPGFSITLRNFTSDAICLVLASEHYLEEDYVYSELEIGYENSIPELEAVPV